MLPIWIRHGRKGIPGYPVAMDAGILAVKALDRAKRRLSGQFSDEERLRIAQALLEDSLELCKSASFLTWWVASDDADALSLARDYGFNGVRDRTGTLNGALQQAVQVAKAEGAESVTMIPSDIPLAWAGDLRDIVDTGATSDVVVVPSARDGGTNALYLRPPDLLTPRFGTASLQAHLSLAERLGMRCSILVLTRLALDIDTVDDVDEFLRKDSRGTSATYAVLKELRPEGIPAE